MPKFRDEAGNIWEDYGQGPVLVQAAQSNGPQTLAPPNPMQAPQLQQATNQAQASQFAAPKAEADVADAQLTVEERRRKLTSEERAKAIKELRSGFQTDNILQTIRRARKTAQEEGGLGWASLTAGVPNTTARKLKGDLETIFGNLSFTRLQQMRDESPTGGAVGNASDRDISLLGSTVANIMDQGVDLPTFLERLDQVERSFIGMQIAAAGIDPTSEEGRSVFKQDFGYTGLFDGEAPLMRGQLDPNATEAGGFLPPEYQAAHQRYLRDNWGNLDPNAYTRFRVALDNEFNLTPNLGAYSQFAGTANQIATQGGSPDSFGAIRAPDRVLSPIEQGINAAAQTPLGAGAANMGNAFAMGLPGMAAGNQDELELLREARPVSSFIGEMIGSGTGALAMGGVGRLAGGAAARPFLADATHSGVYGATQNPDDPLTGAAFGVGGSIAGDLAGRQIGRAFPEAPGIGARQQFAQARDSVPTSQELSEQASRLYGNMRAQGVASMPEANAEMIERANRILAGRGRIDGTGGMNIEDGTLRQGVNLLNSFAEAPMNPVQAQAVRQRFSEALMSNTPGERGVARQLVNEFDDWSPSVLPGIQEANAVAKRQIEGDQLERTMTRGLFAGNRLPGASVGNSVRTAFGPIERQIAEGATALSPATQSAVLNVTQGDPITNALRFAGKFGGNNPITALGGTATGSLAFMAGADPIVSGGIGLGTMAAGSAAREAASNRTMRAAEDAVLTARGGQDFVDLIEHARKLAQQRSGNFFGGVGGTLSQEYGPRF
jgi:hypothetical protein